MECYLDNAATSHPKPKEVLESVRRALTEENANPGRSGHERALRAANRLLSTREALGAFLGAEDPFRVAFCFNCTDALNLAIKGSLKRGDHAVASALEHNSVLRVLNTLKEKGEIELTIVEPMPDGRIDPASYAVSIRKNTRLFVLTHASNVTGTIQPVESVGQLARANGIRYLIDGAQALGSVPVNVRALGCDLYAFPGHKSLLGPQGTGGLYVAPGVSLDTLREGGTGSASESLSQPDDLPDRYEAGTMNLPGIAGLGAGVELVSKEIRRISERETALSNNLISELGKIPGVTLYSLPSRTVRTGAVSFNVRDISSGDAADWLSRRGICVRAGLHCAPLAHRAQGTLSRGCVRASFGYFSTDDDAETLLRAVRDLAKSAE